MSCVFLYFYCKVIRRYNAYVILKSCLLQLLNFFKFIVICWLIWILQTSYVLVNKHRNTMQQFKPYWTFSYLPLFSVIVAFFNLVLKIAFLSVALIVVRSMRAEITEFGELILSLEINHPTICPLNAEAVTEESY